MRESIKHFFSELWRENAPSLLIKENLSSFFEQNTLRTLATALIVFILLWGVFKFGKKKLKVLKENKRIKSDFFHSFLDTLLETSMLFYLIFDVLITILLLHIDPLFEIRVRYCIFFLLILFFIKFFCKYSNFFVENMLQDNPSAKQNVKTVIQIVIWILGILIFFSNIGIDLSPLLAGLGVAGIAIAFALQNILGDLFSSFSILLSKPFVVGDFVKIGEKSTEKVGTVQAISLKTTTLLSVQGQEIIIPNSTILSTEILNYGKMTHRRQRISLGIQYSTSSEKLEKIPNLVKNAISEIEMVNFERCYLEKITENGFTFLASYDILDPDYEKSLQKNQKIYFSLVKKFEEEKIAFSLPSRRVYSSDNDSQHDK